MENLKKIVIRMPNWIGDVIMALPVIEDVRQKFSSSHIAVLIKEPLNELFLNNKNVDEIIVFEKKSQIKNLLKNKNFDLGILLTNSFSSAFDFFKAKIKKRIGFKKDFRSFLLTKSKKYPEEKIHQVIKYKMLLSLIDMKVSANTKPKLTVLEEEKKQAKDILQKYGVIDRKRKVIGINPLAAYGDAKCWPIDRFFEVAKRLSKEKDVFVVFVGDKKAQRVLEDNFFKNLPKNIINLAGKTDLNLLISIINEFDLFLTNDSGPMHIASALNIPIVAIFGSTSDILTGPYNGGEIINKRVECSPCFKRQCPIDFRCMLKISTDEVFEKIKQNAVL